MLWYKGNVYSYKKLYLIAISVVVLLMTIPIFVLFFRIFLSEDVSSLLYIGSQTATYFLLLYMLEKYDLINYLPPFDYTSLWFKKYYPELYDKYGHDDWVDMDVHQLTLDSGYVNSINEVLSDEGYKDFRKYIKENDYKITMWLL